MNKYLVLLLSKNKSQKIDELQDTLINHNIPTINICDKFMYLDHKKLIEEGFYNLTRAHYINNPSAWDKSFYFISENNLINTYDYFIFIEDDVYSKNHITFINLLQKIEANFTTDLITQSIRPKSNDNPWNRWSESYVRKFENPRHSLNVLCRLSSRLIKTILDYKDINFSFNFHEILFASLCLENNFTYTNYVDEKEINQYIGTIRPDPLIVPENIKDDLIYHPVKFPYNFREKIRKIRIH